MNWRLHQDFWSRRYLLAVLAGLLFASAFPKTSFAGAAWIAPALLLACAYNRRGAEAFRIGYVGGLSAWLALLSWLLHIPVTGLPVVGWLVMSAVLAVYPAVWVWLLSDRIGTGGWLRRASWAVIGAATWVGLEMLRARFLSGFPWNNLGTSQYQLLPLIQIASVTGVYGISFLVAWGSLALYSGFLALFRHPTTRYIWLGEVMLPLTIVLAVCVWGLARMRSQPVATERLRVTFVQPSIPQTVIWNPGENSNRFNQLVELSTHALAEETDLLLWPEAALPEFSEAAFVAITNLIATHRVWMLFGADDVVEKFPPVPADPYAYYNAAFLFDPAGRYVARYHKRKLVMFGEYIPWARWLPFLKWFTPITGGFTAGTEVTHFELERGFSDQDANNPAAPGRLRTSALICFEDTFPHLVREHVDDQTAFLVNLTNNGWFGESAAQWQHAITAAFRAVENGVPLLRACNNGLTCWIDQHGQFRALFRDATGSEYGPGFLHVEIPLPAADEIPGRTFYHRHGDWFGWSCVILSALALAIKLGSNRSHIRPGCPEKSL